MSAVVIDTNVLLVANGTHQGASAECRQACIARLLEIKAKGVVVIDSGHRILGEYRNKTRPNQPKGVGDVFLKWLLQNSANSKRVHQISISETNAKEYAEFPDPALQEVFDPPDRMFAAVANAHPRKPPVWQAVDSKWLNWWPQLQAGGVRIEFLCPADAKRFYAKKFPNNPVPALPDPS